MSFEGKIVACGTKGKGDVAMELTLFGRAASVLIPVAMLAIL